MEPEKLKSELERYGIIQEYYRKNPERIDPNNEYLKDIFERLIDIESKKDQIAEESFNLTKFLLETSPVIGDYL